MSTRRMFAIGIDLGGTKIAAGLCQEGELLRKVIFPTNSARGPEGVVATMVEASIKALGDVPRAEILGIGVGAAGQIDPTANAVLYAPNLKWRDVPLGRMLEQEMHLPVRLVNDVRAATIGEWKFGNGKGLANFMNVFIGTGIGSGFILNGALLQGRTNSAGEVGHVCMDPDGPVCECGKKGCLEAFSSGRGLENQVRACLEQGEESLVRKLVEQDLRRVSGPIIGEAARQGDALCLKLLKRAGRMLGLAFANVHTMLNPDVILLGGGMMALQEFFLPELKKTLKKHILPIAMAEEDLVRPAAFENDAVLMGAAAQFP